MVALLTKHSIVPAFEKAGVSLRISFVKRKRSLSFEISRYYLQVMKISLQKFLISMPSRDRKKRNSKESQIVETKESCLMDNNGRQIWQTYCHSLLNVWANIPAVFVDRNITAKNIKEHYEDDLPMPINAEEEFFWWKGRWESVSKNDRPSTIASSPRGCDHDIYPNLHVLLRNCATIPVILCESERSDGVLKRLNTYLRASIGHTRLSVLAFLYIN